MPELKKRAQARWVQLARNQAGGKQRFELGGEYEPAAGFVQVKWLDPKTVAPEDQFALAAVPDCESKHAAQLLDETLAIFLVEMKDNFSVRRGVKGMAAPFEIGAQFGGVVTSPLYVIQVWPSALDMGMRPRSLKSMMERRAFTRRHGPNSWTPWLSGPRCSWPRP